RPRKRGCHHGFDTQALDGRGCLFTRAAAAEVSPRYQDVETAQLGREALAQHFKGMLAEALAIDVNQIAAGNDDIRIDVVAKFENASLNDRFHYARNSRGSEITPRMAEAARVAGLER